MVDIVRPTVADSICWRSFLMSAQRFNLYRFCFDICGGDSCQKWLCKTVLFIVNLQCHCYTIRHIAGRVSTCSMWSTAVNYSMQCGFIEFVPVVWPKRCPTSLNPALLASWTVVCLSFNLLMMLLLPGWPTMGLNCILKKKKKMEFVSGSSAESWLTMDKLIYSPQTTQVQLPWRFTFKNLHKTYLFSLLYNI